ncbi:MAG: phospholipase D-like domain-containing protein, partial [Phycisphaeraceae bacterium]|nr:phospholipase D-like domain-containing protein [Phycisphaeraceae bacterium]
KSMVVDHRIALIGSYNLDPRSGNLTTEIGVLIEDSKLARLLAADIRRDMHPRNSFYSAIGKKPGGLWHINLMINRVSEALPLDLWPLKPHTQYELRPGQTPVPRNHPRFHRNWKNVGEFPQTRPVGPKQIGAWFTRMLGNVMLPLL